MELESNIQSKIIKYGRLNGWIMIKTIRLNENGHADIFCFKNGKTIFIEVKNEIGRQSELQKLRQKQIENQKFEYHLVRSLEQFKQIIK
jgi:hypothetical protein